MGCVSNRRGSGDQSSGSRVGEPHCEAMSSRAIFDLAARRRVFSKTEVIEVPAGTESFWGWYAKKVRFGRSFRLVPVADVPEYPAPTRRCALWFSGGVESTYTLECIRSLRPDLLSIDDFAVFTGPDRRIGQIHFLCAVVGASLGYERIYLGVERNDLLLSRDARACQYVERTPEFLSAWSSYQPSHRLLSVCSFLQKEEIIQYLHENGIRITGTCDRLDNGAWCGDCFKCFEAFYTAKAVGIDLGFRLTQAGFERCYNEYHAYVESQFRDNYNNAYAHFVRLQLFHHVTFDCASDCAPLGGTDL